MCWNWQVISLWLRGDFILKLKYNNNNNHTSSSFATMADTKKVHEENPELFPKLKEDRGSDYMHQRDVKTGNERLPRRSAHPNKGAAKKGGHGGKFTIDGPYNEEDYVDDAPTGALDEHDPNFVDPAEEEADKEAGIPTVEVAKVAHTGVGKLEFAE